MTDDLKFLTKMTTFTMADGSKIVAKQKPKTYCAKHVRTLDGKTIATRIGRKNWFRKTEMTFEEFSELIRDFCIAENLRPVKRIIQII